MTTDPGISGITGIADQIPVTVADHHEQACAKFAGLARHLKKALPGLIVETEHIGGTAVDGLIGRPTVDALLLVSDLYQFDQQSTLLAQLGFRSGGDGGTAGQRRFQLGSGVNCDANLFVYEPGDQAALHHLLIRDYLRANIDEKRRFGELKSRLMERHPTNRKAYRAGKRPRLQRLLEQATGRR